MMTTVSIRAVLLSGVQIASGLLLMCLTDLHKSIVTSSLDPGDEYLAKRNSGALPSTVIIAIAGTTLISKTWSLLLITKIKVGGSFSGSNSIMVVIYRTRVHRALESLIRLQCV